MRNVMEVVKLPVIYHSDGNIMPLMEEIIGLGVAGIANMEPGPMDIEEVKRLYGDRVTIVGNIDLHYTLTNGTPEETRDEVRRRIEALAPGGRYILASANSLPNYVKPANVRAMGESPVAVRDLHGKTQGPHRNAQPPAPPKSPQPAAAGPTTGSADGFPYSNHPERHHRARPGEDRRVGSTRGGRRLPGQSRSSKMGLSKPWIRSGRASPRM